MSEIIQPIVNIINFSDLPNLPYKKACITIGNFDGVHRGHQAIITRMVAEAQSQKRPVLVVTFFPNPTAFFNQQEARYYLSTPWGKEAQLLALGVDRVITFRFDHDFAGLSAEMFLSALKEKAGLRTLVVGPDFALGKDRRGSVSKIKSIGQKLSFSVETISQIKFSGDEISSTLIRQMLDRGAVDQAAELLGRPYTVTGVITHGSDRGARIGLPTANITPWAYKKLPGVGVYATWVNLLGRDHLGITNVGYRPTFEDQSEVNIETHILDFDGNIYGETMHLAFIKKLRDEQKFSGVKAFLAQIERDKASARRIFENAKT